MAYFRTGFLAVLYGSLCLLLGCGPAKGVSVSGQLLNKGQPYLPREKEEVTVRFMPDGNSTLPVCTGQFDPKTGKFTLSGPQANQGVPAGKYKVVVTSIIYGESGKDLFANEFSEQKTPLRYEVSKDAKQSIKVDLGTKTVTKE